MKPPLRLVPWCRPIDRVYHPGRRVSPKRTPGIWTLRPDSISGFLRAFFWRHRMLEAALIAFIMTAAGAVVLGWLIR